MPDPNEQGPAEPSHEARRRNLLRLGVAAPMVLTLVPGSSFADSAAMCARKQSGFDQQRGELANKLAQTPDEWIRVQVDIVTLRPAIGEGKIEGEYVLGTVQQTWWRGESSGSAAGPSPTPGVPPAAGWGPGPVPTWGAAAARLGGIGKARGTSRISTATASRPCASACARALQGWLSRKGCESQISLPAESRRPPSRRVVETPLSAISRSSRSSA